ncbi:MAG: hypothetical protein ACRC1L_06180 [Prochlorococcaceae cyanobacterium]
MPFDAGYGDPEVHPQPESYRGCVNTLGIRSFCDGDDLIDLAHHRLVSPGHHRRRLISPSAGAGC